MRAATRADIKDAFVALGYQGEDFEASSDVIRKLAQLPSVFWSETHGCREALIWRGTRANSELYSEDIIYGDFVPESLLCICEVYTRVLTLKVSIDPRVGKACFVRYPACSMWLLLLGSCGPATLANTQSLYTRVHVSYGPLNFGYVLTTLVHLK